MDWRTYSPTHPSGSIHWANKNVNFKYILNAVCCENSCPSAMSIIIVIDFTSHRPTEPTDRQILFEARQPPGQHINSGTREKVQLQSPRRRRRRHQHVNEEHDPKHIAVIPLLNLLSFVSGQSWIVPSCCNSPESLLDLDVSLWTTWFVRSHPREQYSTFTCQKSPPLLWIYSCYWLYLRVNSFVQNRVIVQLSYCCFQVQTSTSIVLSSARQLLYHVAIYYSIINWI